VNNLVSTLKAVENGAGIASIPHFLTRNSPVIRILKDVEGPVINAYLVYTSELRNSKRVSVFKDFIVRKVKESRF